MQSPSQLEKYLLRVEVNCHSPVGIIANLNWHSRDGVGEWGGRQEDPWQNQTAYWLCYSSGELSCSPDVQQSQSTNTGFKHQEGWLGISCSKHMNSPMASKGGVLKAVSGRRFQGKWWAFAQLDWLTPRWSFDHHQTSGSNPAEVYVLALRSFHLMRVWFL